MERCQCDRDEALLRQCVDVTGQYGDAFGEIALGLRVECAENFGDRLAVDGWFEIRIRAVLPGGHIAILSVAWMPSRVSRASIKTDCGMSSSGRIRFRNNTMPRAAFAAKEGGGAG